MKTLANKLVAAKQARKAKGTDEINALIERAEKTERAQKKEMEDKDTATKGATKSRAMNTRLRKERDDLQTELDGMTARGSGTRTPEA